MARQVPGRWVNAVITFTIPLDVSPDASLSEKLAAVEALNEDRFPDPGQDAVVSMHPETVEG